MSIRASRAIRLLALLAAFSVGACSHSGTEPKKAAPPVISEFSVTPNTNLQPGDAVTVSYVITSETGLVGSVVHASGSFTATDSLGHDGLLSVARTVRLVIPGSAMLTAPLQITVDAYSQSGGHARAVATPITLIDRIPPTVSVRLLSTNSYFVPNDSVSFAIDASDNGQLKWVGYQLGSVADSEMVNASTTSWTVKVALPPGSNGSVSLTAFATDGGQQRSAGGPLSFNVINAVRRPVTSSITTADVKDVAYDAKRGVLYLSQPSVPRIGVLSLATMTFGTPINATSVTAGLDLTLSGDTLLVSLRRAAQLGVIDLRQASPSITPVSLAVGNLLNPGPDNLRVLSNSKAIITLTFDGSGYGGQVMEYDLTTGVAKLRTEVGYYGNVTEAAPLARSADRKKMVMLIDDSCCPEGAQVYDAMTDTFSGMKGTVSTYFPSVSADGTGAEFLLANSVYRNDLSLAAQLSPSDFSYGPTALSSDGTTAYLGTTFGYDKVRVSDGAVLERVVLPATPNRFLLLPDSQTLIAVGGGAVMAVDLR